MAAHTFARSSGEECPGKRAKRVDPNFQFPVVTFHLVLLKEIHFKGCSPLWPIALESSELLESRVDASPTALEDTW